MISWLKKHKNFFLSVFLFLVIFPLMAGGVLYFLMIVKYPGNNLQRENIKRLFTRESPVFYDDEATQIGVFFQEEHRRYVKLEEMPANLINAIIAAEDQYFYLHPGIDPFGIIRAFIVNFKAGRVVQGGSTITQQTAKNIFKRRDRSYGAKVKELFNALKLEAHYSKDEILEFYLNQFYVNANGRGIGIAAEYFFNKDIEDLTLEESAFIAGAIKAPTRYNPWAHKGEEATKRAKLLAHKRKKQVLKSMLRLGKITSREYHEAVKKRLCFKRGEISYPLNVILDYVKDELESDRFREILESHGISNISTSGIKVFTTINKEMQDASLYALRKNFSYLQTKLEGYNKKVVQKRYHKLPLKQYNELKVGNFYLGKIKKIERKGKNSSLAIDFGNIEGKVDYQGIENLARPLMLPKPWEEKWGTLTLEHVNKTLKLFKAGDLAFASVRELREETKEMILDLEQRPVLNGEWPS